MHTRWLGVPLLAGLLLLAARDGAARREDGSVAVENTSYVPSDAAWMRRTMDRADEAIAEDDWTTAVRLLQDVVDTREDPEEEGAAAPYVLPVFGTVVYEGAWIVAHHKILEGGVPALDAYAMEFEPAAAALLERAVACRSKTALAEVAEHYLPLDEGRRAILLLADLALEAGDADEALGWLERLEDLEEVTTEGSARLAPWRKARIARTAAALARPDRIGIVEAILAKACAEGVLENVRFAPVPGRDRRRVPTCTGWPTTGGGPGRNVLPPSLGTTFDPVWWRPLERGLWQEEGASGSDRVCPSPWLPPRAVVDGPHAFVCDGGCVEVWDIATGMCLVAEAYLLKNERGRHLGRVDASEVRKELGIREGHGLTLGPVTPQGRIVYVATPDPSGGWNDWDYGEWRDDRLEALLWNGHTLEHLWRNGGDVGSAGMPDLVRLYGTPLLYRGRLWIAGVSRTRGADHEADAWLFGLSPLTGAVEVRTYLGSGAPARPGRPDEAIPSSPAGARGRVVVATSLGIVAAVDAHSGRPHWIYRNDRGVVGRGRPRRLSNEVDTTPRESGFVNQPPLLGLERVWVAPTDGPYLLCLFDRPRGSKRLLVCARRHRQHDFGTLAVEQIAGLHPGSDEQGPLLVVVGKGMASEGQPPAPIARGLDPLTLEGTGWQAFATTGDGPEPYGTALVTSREVFVPTRHGISVFDLATGHDVNTLDVGSVPPERLQALSPDVPLSGNLVPVPGRGILVVNGTHAVFWRSK